jgi:hypothetical protein
VDAVTTRRWADGELVWFAVSVLDPALQDAAPRLLMGYERAGMQWRRAYPAGTPHLRQAWRNFARDMPAVLRQAARLDPVPWQAALRELCMRSGTRPVGWWLTGSAALAVRGAPLAPGDLDLVGTGQDALALADLFAAELIEPVAQDNNPGSISRWWGRAFCHARIEWIGDPRPWVDQPRPTDFGTTASAQLDTVMFEDWPVLVPPLALQREVCQRRGLADRVVMIDALTS